jgi:hypothetical protein
MAAITISADFLTRLREFYTMAHQEISSDTRKQIAPNNGITDYAIPAYILAVAAVEAFVNEMFLAISPGFLKGSSLEKLSPSDLQEYRKKTLREKLLQLPDLAFDQNVFNSSHQPFQDMNYLIEVRDSFVHYKMEVSVEYKGIFEYLVREGVARGSPDDPSRFWVSDLSTLEGIRWAHNTAVKIIKEIIDTAIKTHRHPLLISLGNHSINFFHLIPSPNETQRWSEWMKLYTKWKRFDPERPPAEKK